MIVHTISKFHIFVRAAVYKQINITTSSLCSILFKFLIFFFFLEMRIGGGISITISQDSYESTVLGRVLYCLNDMIHSAGCLGVSPPAMSNRSLITQQLHLNVHVKKNHRRNNVMERNNPFKTWAVV